jgi:hypothetical protein
MMQLSNDAAFIDAVWEPLSNDVVWILSPDDGHKVIYLRFIDFRQIISIPINASITLDTTSPVIEILLNGGAQYTTEEVVTVTMDYRDASPATSMWVSRVDRFNEADEVPFSPEFPWTVPPREGVHDIYVQVHDLAGNDVVAHTSIFYASILPKVTVSLPEGDVSGSHDEVPMGASAEDPYGGVEFSFAMDVDPLDDPTWLPDGGPFFVDIPDAASEGVHQVMVRARNAAGLVSEMSSVNITLDWTGPTVTLESPTDGSILPQAGLDVLLHLIAHDPSGIDSARYRVDGGQWTDLGAEDLSTVMTMEEFGEHTVVAEVTDGVGNNAVVRSVFRVEDSEAQVESDNSWMFLLVIVVLVVIAGIGYGVMRHIRGDPAMGDRTEPKEDKEDVSRPSPVAPGSAAGTTEPPVAVPGHDAGAAVPSTEGPSVHTDDDGTEWEMV